MSSRSTFTGGVGGLQHLMRVYTYGTYVLRIRGSSRVPEYGEAPTQILWSRLKKKEVPLGALFGDDN